MSTRLGNQGVVNPNGSGVLRTLLITPIVLLALALGGCDEGYPSYYTTVDKMIGQSNVELVHALPNPTGYPASAVAFVDDAVLAVGAGDSVYFVDVRDPAAPAVISIIEIPDTTDGFPFYLIPAEGYLYATDGDIFDHAMFVIDVRKPSSPQLVNRIEHGVRGRGWVTEDGYLYLNSVLRLGVQIWDTTEPSDPFMVGVYYPPQARLGLDEIDPAYRLPPVAATPRQIAAEKELGVFSAHNDLAACDDWYNGSIDSVDFENGLLYVVVDDAGCVVRQGRELQPIDDSGLWIVDVGTPAEPVPVGFLPMGDAVLDGVTVAGDYAYLSASTEGLQIVDVSDPARPALVGGHDTPYAASAVAVEGDIAYVMDRRNSVQVFNIANPAKPVRIGMVADSFNELRDIAVRAGYIYLTGNNYEMSDSSLFILRLVDPNARPDELHWGATSD